MPFPYDPTNWYWTINNDTQQRVYSSKAADYVPLTNPAYVAWVAAGNTTPSAYTEAELGSTLAPYYPDVPRPLPAGILDGYQQAQADEIFQHKLMKYLFNLENRVRVLEGKQPVTVQQARNAMKGQM